MDKPLIGINVDIPSSEQFCRTCTISNFLQWPQNIHRAGGIPVLMPPINDDQDIDRFLRSLQGFVVAGQTDLGPLSDTPLVEDAFEIRLLRRIAQHRLPVMGIGVGIQAMNVAQGGRLRFVEHLESRSRKHHHAQDSRHALKTKAGSLIDRVYKQSGALVISAHEKAISEVASCFTVTARCPDGVVEVIESKLRQWFAIGLQFQPEGDFANALDRRIFAEFIDEVVHRSDTSASVV